MARIGCICSSKPSPPAARRPDGKSPCANTCNKEQTPVKVFAGDGSSPEADSGPRNRNPEFVKAILTTTTLLAKSSDHAMRILKEQGLDLAVKDAFRDFDCINFGSGPVDTTQLRELGRSTVEAFTTP